MIYGGKMARPVFLSGKQINSCLNYHCHWIPYLTTDGKWLNGRERGAASKKA
jgi:hypothetical protein